MQISELFSRIPAPLWLLASAFFLGAGDYTSKLWADSPRMSLAVATVAFYCCSSLSWLPALFKRNELAVMGIIWSILAALATIFIGVVVFKETLTASQWTGVGVGLVSLFLLMK